MNTIALKTRDNPEQISDTIEILTDLLSRCTDHRKSKAAAEEASRFEDVAEYDVDARVLLLQIKDKAKLIEETAPVWQALYDADPGNEVVVRNLISSHAKHRRKKDARALLDRHFDAESGNRALLMRRAGLLDQIGFSDEGFALYEQLIEAKPEDKRARIHYAVRLDKVGRYADALAVATPLADEIAKEERYAVMQQGWRDKVECLSRLMPDRPLEGADCRMLALEALLRKYENREPREIGETMKIALLTGGLGAGGAERQLTRLARLIKSKHGANHEVSVIVKSLLLSEVKPNDFFLPDMREAEIDVVEIEEMEPILAHRQVALDDDTALLFSMMPPQVHYGVTRIAPHYRDIDCDVASVWQDGATLYGALAALFAGVPKIHLVFRGLPPSVRTERNRPEYEILFKGMAKIPGVSLMCNSKLVALEYARWLDLPNDRVEILYNAVTVPPTAVSPEDEQKWLEFDERTKDAEATLGGVFRLEALKQPTLWVRFAARYASHYPNSRFILVGDGRLREQLDKQIADLGLTDRFLLVGRSRSIDFWYDKMDVKLLLSRFEGLPNVLIEAQSAGLPVIATPTGGSSECFIEGKTGYILDDIIKPDLDAASEKVHELATRFRADPAGSASARAFADERFSEQQSLQTFLEICHS